MFLFCYFRLYFFLLLGLLLSAILLLYSFSFADNLVVELHIDIRVFIPARLRKSVAIELFGSFEFLRNKLVDTFIICGFIPSYWQISNKYNMVAYARYKFYAFIWTNIYLFDLFIAFAIGVMAKCANGLLMFPVATIKSLVYLELGRIPPLSSK